MPRSFFGRDIMRIYRGRIEATNSNIRRMGLSWESLGTGGEGFNRETRCHSLSDVFLILDIRNVYIYISHGSIRKHKHIS